MGHVHPCRLRTNSITTRRAAPSETRSDRGSTSPRERPLAYTPCKISAFGRRSHVSRSRWASAGEGSHCTLRRWLIFGRLWDVLGDGEIRNIADFAAEHFRTHRRPLRIAVDEACWRFTNLTPEQVEKIREGVPAANPVEKVILWRILRLWRLNIQLLFVWDGLRKPGKGRGRGGKVDSNCVELLHRMFEVLKVPYHRAPGEAEAECARLEKAGIVDAVWSDDGDSFMFGCQTLIKQHKVGGKRISDHVRIYRAETIARENDFDANSFVLFAVLAGGDYDKAGLPGCGPQTAKWVARRSKGLAKALVEASDRDLPAWRSQLANAIRKLDVPPTFPNTRALKNYWQPNVTTEEQCHSIYRLRNGFDINFNQAKARTELRDRYNFTTREYLKHLAPIFLVRRLARLQSPDQRNENLSFDVHLKPTRATKRSEEDASAESEVKITFAAPLLVAIDLTTTPPEEDWGKFAAKDGTPYDPMQNIGCEVLRCFLEHGLPAGSYTAPVKSKAQTAPEHGEQPAGDLNADVHARQCAPSSAKISKKRDRPATRADQAGEDVQSDSTSPQKRARSSEEDVSSKMKAKGRIKAKEETPSPPPTTFKRPEILKIAEVVDLCDDDSGCDTEQTGSGLFVSSASAQSSVPKAKSRPISVYRPLRPLALSQEARDDQAANRTTSKAWTASPHAKINVNVKEARKGAPRQATTPREPLAAAVKPKALLEPIFPVPVAASARQTHTPLPQTHTLRGENTVKVAGVPVALAASLTPGETIIPSTLRELRAAAFSHTAGARKGEHEMALFDAPPAVVTRLSVPKEVIDLT
ncbi:hypothetical protein DOTSEDRAFT_166539 [Dothistroma septosporum NZE10]|uniref:XPG-I domain-containing protein n=1 Tax=Dothistroma septosporum (strain NZE10 / CBS 128990) TaxID=675120 RepID=N1PVQ4_DOTSN|nr:hypothetical protein DOTSEDRAFT_166539 [Dothistroma septosporum NZE10]